MEIPRMLGDTIKIDSLRTDSLILDTARNFQYIPALAINNSTNKKLNYIYLNKGEKHGLYEDMGVVEPHGVVGVVINSSTNYSVVMPITNEKSSLSVKIKNQGYIMTKFMILIAMFSSICLSSMANERSPFTDIKFGWIIGRGDFIKVTNDLINPDKTHYLIQVEGVDYKDIIKAVRSKYGKKNYKCRMSEHFVETMAAVGIEIGETVDLQLYAFDGGHKVFDLKDVPVTQENLEMIMFERSYCE